MKNNLAKSSSLELSGRRILVVDNNEVNLEIITKLLNAVGVIVDTALNTQIAIEKIKYNNFEIDLILLNLQTPQLNGYESIGLIRRLNSSIPVIALAPEANILRKDEVKSHGFCELITKPYSSTAFFEKIRFCIEAAPNQKINTSLINYINSSVIIQPINILEILSNDYISYKRLLLKYRDKYGLIINQLNNEYQNDTESYFKTIHLLKGVTGTIGAIKLYELLVEIEQNHENPELLEIYQNKFNSLQIEFLEFIEILESFS